jgi:hypothetical protein
MAVTASLRLLLFAALLARVRARDVGLYRRYDTDPRINIGNMQFAQAIIFALAAALGCIFTYSVWLWSARYVRKLICLGNDKQNFFRTPSAPHAFVKRHLLDAPLFRSRHGEKLQMARGLDLGVLPTRFQTLFLGGLIAMNIAFLFVGIEWYMPGSEVTIDHFRNRSGALAVAHLIPLVLMAGRNNPLIWLLGISFDTFNLMHRWFGRILASLAIVHVTATVISTVKYCERTRNRGRVQG